MFSKLTLAAIALAALTSNNTVLAAERSASSVVEIIDFSYQLIDLNPDDGITPALSVLGTPPAWANAMYGESSTIQQVQRLDGYGTVSITAPFGSASSTFDMNSATSSASISGNPGSAQSQWLSTETSNGLNFRLTPATGLLLTGTANFYGTAAAESERSGAVFLNGKINNSRGTVSEFERVHRSRTDTTYYMLGYLHTNDEAAEGHFQFGSYVGVGLSGNVVAPPVPEPESWAMLLAGLALTGTIARRRRQVRG